MPQFPHKRERETQSVGTWIVIVVVTLEVVVVKVGFFIERSMDLFVERVKQ